MGSKEVCVSVVGNLRNQNREKLKRNICVSILPRGGGKRTRF
jgi:hypothetical protein